MAGDDQEKTEEASSKKIEDARKEGNVPKSQDSAAVVTMVVAVVMVLSFLNYMGDHIVRLYRYYQSFIGVELNPKILHQIAIRTLFEMVIIVLPITLAIMVAGVLGNIMQFGFIFTTKPIMPKLSKINPLKGLKNLLSLKKLIDAVKIILKVGVIFTIAFIFLLDFIHEMPRLELISMIPQLAWLKKKAIILAAVVVIAFLILSFLDLMIVRFQYFQGLRMSKQEVKDEYKQMEGDPQVKGRIRQLQREMARKRMVQDVSSADVVITNPTHYAVALRYDTKQEDAPVVLAKGVDFLALKIKDMARQHDVMIYENPPLARELYKNCEINEIIPKELFKAVAEVLSFVYTSNKKKFKDRLK